MKIEFIDVDCEEDFDYESECWIGYNVTIRVFDVVVYRYTTEIAPNVDEIRSDFIRSMFASAVENFEKGRE